MVLTIAITTYNQGEFLGKLLEKINIIKKNSQIEIILIDDHSTDQKAEDYITQFARKNRVIQNIKNHNSPSFSRNLAINLAQGKYLFFIDGDDLILGDIDLLVDELKVSSDDVILSVPMRITKSGNYLCTLKYGSQILDDDDTKFMHNNMKYLAFNMGIYNIYKTNFLKEKQIYFELENRNEDHIFNHLILASSPKIGRTKVNYYGWRLNYQSYSHTTSSILVKSKLSLLDRQLLILNKQEKCLANIMWYNLFETNIVDLLRGYPKLTIKKRYKFFKDCQQILQQYHHDFNYDDPHIYYLIYKKTKSFLIFEMLYQSLRIVRFLKGSFK